MLFPLPDFFEEFLAAQVMTRNLLRVELALDHDLRGDAGVVGAGLPQRVVAVHAMEARERVHDGVLEGVAHVQRAGDVGRRQQDAVILPGVVVASGLEIARVFPVRIPALFDVGGFEGFGEFHGAGGQGKGAIIPEGREWANPESG